MTERAYFYALGKRKTARACVKLFSEGKGDITINGKTLREWADNEEMITTIMAPLKLLSIQKDYDVVITVSGGGKTAQADAAQLGISRALIKKNAELGSPGFI